MTAAVRSLLARFRQAGATLTCSSDGRVHFAAPAPLPAALLAEARQQRDAIARALAEPATLDLGDLPAAPCLACGCRSFWRVSVLSGGPGPWRCTKCTSPDREVWLDGHALSAGDA
jgi:hypothetical protein